MDKHCTRTRNIIWKIYGFEPSRKCFANLAKIAAADKRIQICKFGLGLENHKIELFESGLMSVHI